METEWQQISWGFGSIYVALEASITPYFNYCILLNVMESRNRPGVAQRVPGVLGSQIFMTFGKWRRWGRQPHAPAAFNPRKCPWYSFSPEAESTPGPWNGRKEYVTEKSNDITGNRSRDRPTSSVAPQPLRHPRPLYILLRRSVILCCWLLCSKKMEFWRALN
jgi:hypothetical protein